MVGNMIFKNPLSTPFSFLQDSLLLTDKLPTMEACGCHFSSEEIYLTLYFTSCFKIILLPLADLFGMSEKSQWEIKAFSEINVNVHEPSILCWFRQTIPSQVRC